MAETSPSLNIFGIRHHGPGSAQSLLDALETVQPDVILVEGPPDAEEVLPLLMHADMEPPVALLIHAVDNPKLAVFYPFAHFSPEWQALRFGLQRKIPVRFMDLPQTHQLAFDVRENEEAASPEEGHENPDTKAQEDAPVPEDPLNLLARAAGHEDGEHWWELLVEQRKNSIDVFNGIAEAMAALRETCPAANNARHAERERLREAWMRKTLRAAQKDGFRSIAVVCGAWHAPALAADVSSPKDDNALLKGLPKVRVQATWTPWTHGRLSYRSGYGAGIESPGWYEHLWLSAQKGGGPVSICWMTRVARLLREEEYDVSSAHIIDAVRLAESVAAMRNLSLPGLAEMNEAAQTVLCSGSMVPMALVNRKLIVGERLGRIPSETPTVPLQQDFERIQKRLRLKVTAEAKTYDFDLRNQTGLERSQLLHRLQLLGVPWGELCQPAARAKGTFHEVWNIQWQPEFAVSIIEASVWGRTVYDAVTGFVCDGLDKAQTLDVITGLIEGILLAELQDSIEHAIKRLQEKAAAASESTLIMDALPPLANALRYGNVRKTDTALLAQVLDGLLVRVFIGLPGACHALDDDAAEQMYRRIVATGQVVTQIERQEHIESWHRVLATLARQNGLHGLVAGRCCRLLLDAGAIDGNQAARQFGLALSCGVEPNAAGSWLEGFLRGSGLVLLYDERLIGLVDRWACALDMERFQAVLPLLRRAFSSFNAHERRQIGERVKQGKTIPTDGDGNSAETFDQAAADAALPLVARMLGL